MERSTSNQARELEQLHSRFWRNLTRTFALVQVATELGTDDDPPELSLESEDVIRAVIVFLYASVEDFLRGLAHILYERLSEDRLDRIRIRVGSKNLKKIGLGTLRRHPDKRFGAVVRDSVNEWLSKKSFTDAQAVVAILQELEITIDQSWAGYLESLDQLMLRRHRIVHNADLIEPTDIQPERITQPESQMIIRWFHDVDFFVTELVISLLPTTTATSMSKDLIERKKRRKKFEARKDKTSGEDADS